MASERDEGKRECEGEQEGRKGGEEESRAELTWYSSPCLVEQIRESLVEVSISGFFLYVYESKS